MTKNAEDTRNEELLDLLSDALERRALEEVRTLLAGLHPGEIAALIESLPQDERAAVWDQIGAEDFTEVLAELDDAVRLARVREMDAEALADVAEDLDTDDAADILQDLPEERVEEVLQAMDAQDRERVAAVLQYPEDTAGGLMNLDVITVRADVTLEVVLRYLRRRGEIPEKTNRLFVVDRDGRYLGELRVADLLVEPPERVVGELMSTEQPGIPADTPDHEVARLFEQRNLISAPVIDEHGRLLGRITVDDVVDVIREEGEESLMSMAGLDVEEDLFAPVLSTSRRRLLWLAVNLCTALIAAAVISRFEATIEQVVALAVLMPLVASMGGIAGTQTLTIMIRGMALGQVQRSNAADLLRRELLVGVINGVVWAVAMALVASLWFADARVGLIVGVALAGNLVVAAAVGVLVPLVLRRLRIDPALAGGVVLTTFTDITGFALILGLGTAFLLA